MAEDKGQILLYQTLYGESRIEVRLQDETLWLSLDQMAELFQRNKSPISKHIKNVLEEEELNKEVVVAKYATTTQHGAIEGKSQTHQVEFYNLDMIIIVLQDNKHTDAEKENRLKQIDIEIHQMEEMMKNDLEYRGLLIP